MAGGLPWIRLYRDLPTHPKILELESTIPLGLAYVVRIWCEVAAHHPDGVIRSSDAVVERWAGWAGVPGALVSALVSAGLLDESGECLTVHGWDEHQSAVKAKVERDRAHFAAKSMTRSGVRHGVVAESVTE